MQIGGNWSPIRLMKFGYFWRQIYLASFYHHPFPCRNSPAKNKGKIYIVYASCRSQLVLSSNQSRLSGRLFPWIFSPTLVARKIFMESEAGMPVTIRLWFIFDYGNNSLRKALYYKAHKNVFPMDFHTFLTRSSQRLANFD